ncbi:WD40 repeat-like protein [Phlegmacium glaucopus]|nr:WD40 repeat-like protein [Phlegmacium glaucopus]
MLDSTSRQSQPETGLTLITWSAPKTCPKIKLTSFTTATPHLPVTRQRYSNAPDSTPLRGITARRALGMQTPKRTPLFMPESSSPMAFPSSSPVKTPHRRTALPLDEPPNSDPLDFPSSPITTNKTPKNRQGDIHSSLAITPSSSARRPRRTQPTAQPALGPDNLTSDILDVPASSAPNLSAQLAPSDEPDEIRAILGTTVNLAETMKLFRDFLKGFKPKYRVSYDRELGLKTRAFTSPTEGEAILYETYFRRMRQTGETNLNLDVVNLVAYPPSKKLHLALCLAPNGRHSPVYWNTNKGKGKSKAGGFFAVRFGNNSRRDLSDSINYSELPPLDGEEGELIDDEACFIDARAITGIDILSLLCPSNAKHVSNDTTIPSVSPGRNSTIINEGDAEPHVALHALLACRLVSRTWCRLASDNAVWRALFLGRWKVDLRRASPGNHERTRNQNATSAPLQLDWWILYRDRLELDLRWSGATDGPIFRDTDTTRLGRSSDNNSGFLLASSKDLGAHKDKDWEPKLTRISGHFDRRIITGSRDRTIKVWSLRTGALLATFLGVHQGSVLCLKFEGDWDRSWADNESDSNGDGSFNLEVDGGGAGHFGHRDDLARGRRKGRRNRKGFMVSGSSDCSICVWNLGLGPVVEHDSDMNGYSNQMHVDDDGERQVTAVFGICGKVVSASGDGNMILWDIASGERLRTFEGHDRGLACIEFKDDLIVSGSNDCKIKVWSAVTGECLRMLVGHEALVRALSFDPRSGRLVSASYDKSVKLWDLGTGKLVREFRGTHNIFDVKFDVARIVSTSHNQKIVVLDFSAGLDAKLFV